jgi:hypothetical protein
MRHSETQGVEERQRATRKGLLLSELAALVLPRLRWASHTRSPEGPLRAGESELGSPARCELLRVDFDIEIMPSGRVVRNSATWLAV